MATLQAALDEANKCIKRQKTCASKGNSVLDQVIGMVEVAQQQLANRGDGLDPEATLATLSKRIEGAGLFKELNSTTKEFHTSVAKLGKSLEKACDLDADVCRALRPAPTVAAAASTSATAKGSGSSGDTVSAAAAADLREDPALLARVIAEHFYREGRFALGDALASEAGLMDTEGIREPYAAMHTVLEQIRTHNLGPALEWAVQHRPALSADGGPSAFEFRLHSLNFVHALQSAGRTAALSYAKAHFGPHALRGHMPDIQRLMGCLLFADRCSSFSSTAGAGPGAGPDLYRKQQQGYGPGDQPSSSTSAEAAAGGQPSGQHHPYSDLLSPSCWDAAAREFATQACSLMGQASESPLTTVVAAGSVALPTLLKLAAVMEKNAQDLRSVDQLPVEIELGPSFVFRSIFACPVSRDMSTTDNPPLLLPCGHVLCEQSVAKLAKNRSRAFKCPYCPMEARMDALRPLTFPGVD